MYLALDYGTRYIGVAATDQDGTITYRYGVIDQTKENALEAIKSIVERERIQTLIVGVPIGLSGNETQQTALTKKFIASLKTFLPTLDIQEVDETLTSVEAQQHVAFEGGGKHDEHAEAARLMLEDFIHRS